MRQQRSLHRLFLGMVFTLVIVTLCPGLWAGITTIGTDPGYVGGTDPWSVDDLIVGSTADGSVAVSGGSDVLVGGSAYLAWSDGEDDFLAAVTITGAGSTWSVTDMMEVGAYGDATVLVSSGGGLGADEFWIGGHNPGYSTLAEYFAPGADLGGGSGQVTVTGVGSTLEAGGLNIGAFGEGTLDVNDGAHLTSWSTWLGVGPEVTGTATLSGIGSTWTNNRELVVGAWGNGTVIVEDGASSSTEDAYLGGMPLSLIDNISTDGVEQPAGTGDVTITGAGSTWDVNDVLAVGGWGTGTLTVSAGAQTTAAEVYIGGLAFDAIGESYDPNNKPSGTGTVTVTGEGSVLDVTGFSSLYVGYFGDGTLDVNNGGDVTTSMAVLGGGTDAVGTVTVDGTGSTLEAEREIIVGAWGEGTLTVSGGADVTAQTVLIGGFDVNEAEMDAAMLADFGTEALGTGTVTVTGTGSTLTVTGEETLVVGGWGTGTMTVAAGGTVTSQEAMIGGYDPMFDTLAEYFDPNADLGGGTGTATVTGSGSTWNTDGLSVGFSGEGTLEIAAGGTVAADNTWVGAMPDVNGTVEVSGSGSTWSNTSEMVVGVWGEGDVTIEDGADANAADIYLGGASFELMNTPYDANRIPDGTGTMTVKGAGSTLDASGALYVGYSGDGTLDVNDGGQVSSGMGVLGGGPYSVGTVTVRGGEEGENSTWDITEGLVVGAWGQGDLTISGGGQVTAQEVLIGGFDVNEADFDPNMLADIGNEARGTGTVTVTGSGSRLDVTSPTSLYIGFTGTGTLNVNSGGDVTSETAGVGVMPDSTGTVTVDGAGSTWDNSGSMFVGGYGTGTLTVSGTGHVDIGNILYIGGFDDEQMGFDTATVGYDPNGTGTVTVTGSGTTLEAVGIGVGVKGNGTLQILNGAEVQAQAVAVGIDSDGTGLVTVDGGGSTLQISTEGTPIEVPTLAGEGNLIVSNGGEVIVDSNGILLVADDISVGSEGEGSSMTISDGGTVVSNRGIIGGSDPNYDNLADYFAEEADLGMGTGTVTVTGANADQASSWEAESLMVGFSGDGTLEITDGGQVTDYMGMVGVVPDVNGTVRVSGNASTWTNDSGLVVGAWGTGLLTIEDSATVTAPEVYIGGMSFDAIEEDYDAAYIPTGTGTVTVTGDGSTLEITSNSSLYVGYYGTGTLDVNEGGYVASESAGIGVIGGSTGRVTVDGAIPGEEEDTPSEWHNSGAAFVGGWGTGYLTVSDGGLVDIENTLFIGGFDADRFDVDNPQTEADPAGTGTVIVTGQDSTLYGTGLPDLWAGYSGTGTLNVTEGGYVEAGDVGVGVMPGSTGTVLVDGAAEVGEGSDIPSKLYVMDSAFVGGYGPGTLMVSGGAEATVGNMLYISGFRPADFNVDTEAVGYDPNAIGTVTVTDTDSYLETAGLVVGTLGPGTLNVLAGGEVASEVGVIGFGPDSTGQVTVDGVGSIWQLRNEQEGDDWSILGVGIYGLGGLTVSNGSSVWVADAVVGGFDLADIGAEEYQALWGDPTGTGTALVTGSNSLLNVTYDLCVGHSGTGTLTVSSGGRVNSGWGYLGDYEGASGTALVTGEGSLWSVDEDLYVGGNEEGSGGTGILTVSNGGEVQVGHELFVWETGTLKGDGTVVISSPTTLFNYGTIAPGNSIGTLTVEGNVVFEPNSVFEVEIANDDTGDKLDVAGNVDILGGTVKAIAVGTIVGSHEYQIIEADSVTGTFDVLDTALVQSVTNTNLEYDPNAVWLTITAMAFDDPNVWRTRNQRAVGTALQQIAEEEGGNDITDALQQLEDVNDIRHSYDQLCGQIRPTLAPITTAGTNRFMGTVSDRMHGGLISRSGSFGGRQSVMAGPAADLSSGRTYESNPYGQVFAVGNGSSILGDKPWGLWGKGYGLFGDRESKDGVTGYQYRTYGFGMGADYQVKEGLLAGVTLGFSDSQADYFASRDESNADAFHVGVYGRHTRGSWYVDGLLTYSRMGYSTDRYVDLTSEHLVGEFDGTDLGGYFETGFQWRELEGWKINPLAGLQVSFLDVDGYTETGGASALTFGDQSYESIRGSLGARAIKDLSERFFGMRALWEIRGRWVHEFGDSQSVVDASFASDPTVVFEVADAEASRDSAVLGTGFNARINARTRVSVDYDVRFNSNDTTHVLGVVGEYRW